MKTKAGHLTYCTNIHPGENWSSHFIELEKYLPNIKKEVAPHSKMGIGLRVSNQMSLDLSNVATLTNFKSWLEENNFYVFTINGFPYGAFHGTIIKDKVHKPDWTTRERVQYTIRLFHILRQLLPDDIERGSISTSPLSYRHWYANDADRNSAMEAATTSIIQIAEHLHNIDRLHGRWLHLDIEPEPGGLVENGNDFIDWYENILIPAAHYQINSQGFNADKAEDIIRKHIQLCYDVCHMAVEFENQKSLINQLKQKNIGIGKIQLSSALRLPVDSDPAILQPFDEPQYLHQVVVRDQNGKILRFKDIPDALVSTPRGEWRIHFHVPLFTRDYGDLSSTQNYIQEILDIHRETPLTDHLETETYTWGVLPEELQLSVDESIVRELKFIQSGL